MKLKDPKSVKVLITIIIFVITAFFLFYRLGHYALWDDEANTALFAQSVWQTGDTYAMLDHNLIAHTHGQELKGMYNRFIPPLPFYLAAPFVGLGPEGSALTPRLPFAICGLLTVGGILWWLWKSEASITTWLLMAMGILGNVSLMLFARQSRYYAVGILAATMLTFLYVYRDHRKRTTVSMVIVSLVLLASNYMYYVAVYACLLVDYSIWGRKAKPLSWREGVAIFVPQIIIGGMLVSVYSLLWERAVSGYMGGSRGMERVFMVFWNLRELNGCELGVGLLIFLAPLLYFTFGNYKMTEGAENRHKSYCQKRFSSYREDKWLLRAPMAIFIYSLAVALMAPLPFPGYNMAHVRYLAPLIPLCIFTTVMSIEVLTARAKWFAVPLAILAFGTNVLHGGPLIKGDDVSRHSYLIAKNHFRSTVFDFTQELFFPITSAYGKTAQWINANVEEKASIWVLPDFATYPLMYHAPKALYAWQLNDWTKQFRELPDIHFFRRDYPDFVIIFGYPQVVQEFLKRPEKEEEMYYRFIKRLDVYWYDLIRPELFWHAFKEVSNYDPQSQAVYIFKKEQP